MYIVIVIKIFRYPFSLFSKMHTFIRVVLILIQQPSWSLTMAREAILILLQL